MSKFYDNITNNFGGAWGYDPHPLDHEAFIGYRAIWKRGRIEYLMDRSSCRGDEKVLNRLLKWWNKRGGVESKWLKADQYEAPFTMSADAAEKDVWTYEDVEAGNVAAVRKSYGYVYITLYHDTPIAR